MHEKKIVHRDLKPENILLENQDDLQDIKLIDFGTAKKWDMDIKKGENNKEETRLYEKVGTILYLAPEIMKANKDEEIFYNELCDMWSVGIIAYILCTGKQPFGNEDDKKMKLHIKNFTLNNEKNESPDHLDIFDPKKFGKEFASISSEDAKDFIRACLTPKFMEKCPYTDQKA